MSPDSHLDPRLLNRRLVTLEGRFQEQIAWCRKCRQDTQDLLGTISRENAVMLSQVAEHTAKVDALLARATCKKARRK